MCVIPPCPGSTRDWVCHATISPYVSSADVSHSCMHTCSYMLLLCAEYDMPIFRVSFAQVYKRIESSVTATTAASH